MLQLESGWEIKIDESPEWLFFRIESGGAESNPPLSGTIWSHAESCGIRRFVCEIGENVLMNSYLVGQLMILHKRAHLEGGTLRICGLSESNNRVLQLMRLTERFPNYATREHAVMGRLP